MYNSATFVVKNQEETALPKVSFAETVMEWESLIAAAGRHADGEPELKKLVDDLSETLEEARRIQNRREQLMGEHQEATQKLGEVKDTGKDLCQRVRNQVKSMLGTKNERLTEFNIRLRRSRRKG